MDRKDIVGSDAKADIDRFIAQASKPATSSRGRLIFALDATMSRQPTWDVAQKVQSQMFEAAGATGLEVQLVYFRGFGECKSSPFKTDAASLAKLMRGIRCEAGETQIAKVLKHAISEASRQPVACMIYVGDAMEENPDELIALARDAGRHGVKVFMFQEQEDEEVEQTFRQIATLSGGAYATFDVGATERLKQLLAAVAVYATGGRKALEADKSEAARLLLAQLR